MKNSSDKKMKWAAFAGVAACSSSYLLVGILGYSLAGDNVQSNFLESIQYETANKILFFTMNFGFLISVFFSFSVMFFGARNNFIAIIKLAFAPPVKSISKWRQNEDDIEQISSYI